MSTTKDGSETQAFHRRENPDEKMISFFNQQENANKNQNKLRSISEDAEQRKRRTLMGARAEPQDPPRTCAQQPTAPGATPRGHASAGCRPVPHAPAAPVGACNNPTISQVKAKKSYIVCFPKFLKTVLRDARSADKTIKNIKR